MPFVPQESTVLTFSLLLVVMIISTSNTCAWTTQDLPTPFTTRNCPLLNRTRQIASSFYGLNNSSATTSLFNYTQDMIQNYELYHCDAVFNTQFNDTAIEGIKIFDYTYTIVDVTLSQQTSYCQYILNSRELFAQTLQLFPHFNNATLMKALFIPYLETLMMDQQRNYSIQRTFYTKGFTNKYSVSSNNVLNLQELVNAFNFFLFCNQSNPYFEIFHTQTLPMIASLSEYT
ncbi:hypothetical protein FDP41_009537 [Naegleria fowleri]|uniref:Uncharacterized protein n=1 Tax=Naegleria fowleri TaxID=5763 RepID=A0A6A5BGT5_NAEFO|nr:uncharacterized protein FDP41_009537 [Naegleria fowleri]KAF0972229.1 hypothetical protein FDP41_009537 [Naegleria fowleri]